MGETMILYVILLDLYGGAQTLHLPLRGFRWACEDEKKVLESYFNIRYNSRDEPDEEFNLNHRDFFPNFEWRDGYWLIDSITKEKVELGQDERWEAFLEVFNHKK